MSEKLSVIAKITAQPGKRAELAAALQPALDTAQGEEGTLAYILLEDSSNEDTLWMYETYASQGALETHMGSEAFKALGPAIGPFLAGRPELIFTKPIGGKGA